MVNKPRRLRQTPAIRKLTSETQLSVNDLVYPLFIQNGLNEPHEVSSMPGQFRYNPDQVLQKVEECVSLGINSFLLFGLASQKNADATESYDPNGPVPIAIRNILKHFPNVAVMTDVCVCGYTDHGHCAIVDKDGIWEDKTNKVLAEMAVTHAQSGAHVVAPSAMMDNQVLAIRQYLDEKGFTNTGIMAYSAKYYSAFYGPFREAANSAPQFGDRAGYQMTPANRDEALKEMEIDKRQGADILMVKPALAYLDIISMAYRKFYLPIAAYNVSGSYSMIKAASEKGWINEEFAVMEMMTSIKRAGTKIIITYFAPDVARILNNR